MADLKISQLSDGGNSQATDEYVIARSGANYRIDGASVAAAATSVGTLTSLTVSGLSTVTGTADTTFRITSTGASGYSVLSQQITNASATGSNYMSISVARDNVDSEPVSTLTLIANNTSVANRHLWAINNYATRVLTVTASGNLGLGVTPSVKLDVTGDVRTSSKYLLGTSTTGTTGQIATDNTNNYFDYLGALIFRTAAASSEKMRLDSSGNLGVGTTSPGVRLDVERSGDGTTAGFAGGTYGIRFDNGGTFSSGMSTIHGVDSTLTTSYQPIMLNGSDVRFGTGATERARIDSSGNMGVGTASILGRFTVAGGYAYVTDDGTRRLVMGPDGTGVLLGTSTNHYLRFITNDTERARITSGGEFLVNTTSSNGQLTAQSTTTDGTSFALGTKDSSGTSLFRVRGDGALYMGLAGNSPYNLTTGSAANAFLDSGGYLYRSTSSLKYKTDIEDATHGLTEVLALRPVTYKGINDGDTVFGGLIAEEVHEAGLSEFVVYDAEGQPDALHYGNMVSLLVKAVQEQQAMIVALEARLEALEA